MNWLVLGLDRNAWKVRFCLDLCYLICIACLVCVSIGTHVFLTEVLCFMIIGDVPAWAKILPGDPFFCAHGLYLLCDPSLVQDP